TALLYLTGCAKEAFGREESAWIETAGERAPAGLHRQVVGTAQARNTIEQDYHITPAFHQTFGTFEHHLGHAGMCLGRLIECRTDHLGAHRALHIRNLFWTLTDQGNHQMRIIIILSDRIGDRFEEHRFAGFWWRDNQTALPATNWSNQVDNTTR